MNPWRHSNWPVIVVVVLGFVWGSCDNIQDSRSISDDSITEAYPALYKSIFHRDARAILPFTTESSSQVRRQAWRALAQTPVDSISSFIKRVENAGSKQAWFALSMHALATPQLRGLENYWKTHPEQRGGVSLALGRQGDAESLSFLLEKMPILTGTEYEGESALAISRLFDRFPARQNQQLKVISAAFSSDDPNLIRRWLYGFYRGADDQLSSAARDSLIHKWKAYGIGQSAKVDQYVAGIIGTSVFTDILDKYQSNNDLQNQVQLGIEVAGLADDLELNQQNVGYLKRLISHPNPHVVQKTMAGLSGRLSSDDSLYVIIKSELSNNNQASPLIWLQALSTAATVDSALVFNHADRLKEISNTYPYLFPDVLQAWMKAESDQVFLKRLKETIEQGDPLRSMYAINAAKMIWSASDKPKQLKNGIRALTFEALSLKDRGVSYSTQLLLQDSILFKNDDFTKIHQYLKDFSLPGDIEVYQTFGALYKKRFEEQARPFIDSLAALGYAPLNRSLQQTGWKVEVPENDNQKFRTPDWGRLWELGKHPIWVLETDKGTIRIKMNTLSAPATVSAIDSLTRAGAYNGVPFHRVVPNFVIQGGDIERQDGFGGPDFTIPTEPSEQGFARGAVGIASAGPDTEGSQYFFMLQWKPHLNGNYTLFGNVIEGMEVVDRIIAGDKVKCAYWE